MSLELLALGANFLSGIMGQRSQDKANRQNLAMQQKSLLQAQKQFDAQMDESVRRRVEDAKSAGVHPLFALGASVGASPTISAGGPGNQRGESPMGDAIGRMAEHLGIIEQNRASAAKDAAEAALFDSERKRIEQEINARGRTGDPDTGTVQTFPLPNDTGYIGPAEYYNPEVATSSRQGVESGVHPIRREVVDPMGNVYTLPTPNAGLDEVGQIEYVMGVPGRMWNNFKKVHKDNAEIRAMDRELEQLRRRRLALTNEPEKVRQYYELVERAKRKARNLRNRLMKWVGQ